MAQLDGKVAVVTGGSRGIGRAIVEALLDGGAQVVFSARTAGDVERTAEQLGRRFPSKTRGVAADVREERDCDRLVAEAMAAFGRLDILVNNAGVGVFAPLAEMTTEAWRAQIATNLDGVFFTSRAAIPHLRASGDGWIVNVGSLAGRNPFAGGTAYNATKFGLLGLSEALMLEVRHQGIRVSCVMPGSVATEFAAGDASGDWKLTAEDVARAVLGLLAYPSRALPSRIELRPSRPPKG